MENKIVKIDPKEFGLEISSAEKITKGLTTILKEREILSEQYSKVIKLETNRDNISTFRELRLQIRDNRTKGIEPWRKTNKEIFLRGGQFVDAIGGKESKENIRMEEQLLKGEKHFEILEQERKAKLKTDREKALEKYEVETEHIQLGEMAEDVWLNYFNGVRLQYDGRIAAEIKAEEDRIAKEKAEKAEQERIRKENEQLRKENEARELREKMKQELIQKRTNELRPYIIFIRDYNKMINSEEKSYQKQLQDIKQAKKEQDEYDKKEEIKRQEDRDEKAKIERELQTKKDEEIKAEQEKQADIEAELSASDKDKFRFIIIDLIQLKEKYTFKSEKFCTLQGQVNELIDKIITFTNSKI